MDFVRETANISDNIEAWDYTLPFILKPFDGESLQGYILRLDAVNNYTPGTVLDGN